MSLLNITDAKLSIGTKLLFENVTFSINHGDRIGLVGNNGSGKTSLIRALQGKQELDSGKVTIAKGVSVGVVSQTLNESVLDETVYDFLVSSLPAHLQETDFWKVDVALSEIELDPENWHAPIGALSGGWQQFIHIISATLKEPDILILDEPTNHLDLEKLLKFEKWLKENVIIPYVLISHDREFLDQCTNKTLFLRPDGMHVFSTPYSKAREALSDEDLSASKSANSEKAEIARLEKTAKRLKEWSTKKGFSEGLARRSKAVQTRVDKLKAEKTEDFKEAKRDLKLDYSDVSASSLVTIEDVIIDTPNGDPIFSISKLQVAKGDRIAILGVNGSGKSQFLRHLIEAVERQKEAFQSGSGFRISPQIKLGYLDQHLETLGDNDSLYKYLNDRFGLDRTQITREMVNAGFPITQQHQKLSDLSGGEKARFALMCLKFMKPNLYILDEPTNHLDIAGQEALEEQLDGDNRTCIFTSHDRHLVKGAANRFLEIDNGDLREIEDPEIFFRKLRGSEPSSSSQHRRFDI